MRRLAFVTGGTGFIGRHLVRRLVAEGWSVRVLVRSTTRARDLEAMGVDLIAGNLDDLTDALLELDKQQRLDSI